MHKTGTFIIPFADGQKIAAFVNLLQRKRNGIGAGAKTHTHDKNTRSKDQGQNRRPCVFLFGSCFCFTVKHMRVVYNRVITITSVTKPKKHTRVFFRPSIFPLTIIAG